MHPEAMNHIKESLERIVRDKPICVLEIGSRDVGGGTPRDLIEASWVGLDVSPGGNVDVVADGATWGTENSFDVVICAEVFEHAESWRDIVENAYRVLQHGGMFIGTAAGEGRIPHSAVNGAHLTHMYENQYANDFELIEYYENITMQELLSTLQDSGFQGISVQTWRPGDIYWTAVK